MNHKFTRFLLFAFLIFPLFGFSQGEFNNWYFGSFAGMTFNSGSPVVFLTSAMNAVASGSSNISDSLGNILFYSEGQAVYNKNNMMMPDGMVGGNGCGYGYVKNNIAFQQLDEPSKYYLFSAGCGALDNLSGLRYSVIDMTLDGGLGDIPVGFSGVDVPGALRGYNAVTATRHHNNHDVWVCARLRDTQNNYFLSYLVNASGINFTPVSSSSRVQLYTPPQASPVIQSLIISRDGTKLAAVYDSVLEYCNFNSTNGQITPLFLVPLPMCGNHPVIPKNAEFSVNSGYLYVSGTGISSCTSPWGFVYQFDATITDSAQFKNSAILITNEVHTPGLQLAPDGKIYCSTIELDSLSVINNPSSPGAACNYQRDALSLLGRSSGRALPDYVERYYAIIHDTGQCPGQNTHFTPAIWPPADSVHWDFGDPVSGAFNFSNLTNPTHNYSNTGTYTVELFVRHIDNRTDTCWKTITILPRQQVALGADRIICLGDSTTFDAGVCSGCTYLWKDLGSGLIVGTSQTFKTGQSGTYAVWVTNSHGCIGSDTVQLTATPAPTIANNPLSKAICSGQSTNIFLISNISGATFHWTATLTSGNITGFNADSGLVINQVLVNTLPTPGIVTYHITPKLGDCSGVPVNFEVTVNAGDSVKVSISASANNVCAGTPVTFTASPTNGGTSPSYQWKVNGINVGTNSPTYGYTPLNGDMVICVLSSNQSCTSNNPASSNQLFMVINSYSVVDVSITASANPSCSGTPVTFTATPVNGGSSPSYQWKVNEINAGPNNPVYSYSPNNGDVVSCILSSSETCTTNNPASSNQLFMVIHSNSVVDLSIIASVNPVCSGIPVTYTAIPVNGGSSPVYQWKVNGVNTGTNNPTYTYNPVSGDLVSCILTSNATCTSNNPATSNTITMNVAAAPIVTFVLCNDSITTTNAQPFKLKGGIPLGGTYSGPGVSNGIFYPAVAGVGTHQINYSYTNAALCTVTDHRSLITINLAPFTCSNPITDVRDGKTYPTILIGTQCWMAANLSYGILIPGNTSQRDNCIPEKYCYNDLTANCGLLTADYQWDELMNYDETVSNQGLCPPGWHVPTETDWNTLFANYINNGFAASPLKYSGFSGFNALLTGVQHLNKTWDYQGFATFFWSSTAHGTTKAWAHGMNDTDPSVSVYPSFRSNAFSVRCLKD